MDDFNNFFDDQRGNDSDRTPVYHTQDPKRSNKANTASVICIVMAVVMCIAVLVNVIVLATLKNTIAEDYAKTISEQMQSQYAKAIEDILQDTDVVNDIKESASNEVLQALNSAVGQVANDVCSASVARLYMYTTDSNLQTTSASGIASGFLISDTDENGTLQRYIVTNAHCVRYVNQRRTSSGGFPIGGWDRIEYYWDSYAKIICTFEGEDSYYTLEIVAYGAYEDDNLSAENEQADLAILRVVGTQPSNESHPSLKIAGVNYSAKRGTPVALIGNPEGIGDTNSISTGTISQTGIKITSWGAGEFVMTDAAVNGGNSGGPMVDIQGVVVGVVESKLVSTDIDNMGFALSASTLRDFITWASEASNNQLNKQLDIQYVAQGV